MKLNKQTLKRIIKEELNNVLYEAGDFNPKIQTVMRTKSMMMKEIQEEMRQCSLYTERYSKQIQLQTD
jgi:hypothetical protein